jgi:hypothetical protein
VSIAAKNNAMRYEFTPAVKPLYGGSIGKARST